MNLTLQLTTLATNLIASLGYGGLALGLVIDSCGVPIPSEVLLPLAGLLVRQGRFNFAAVIAVATVAQTSGAALAYWIGRKGGVKIVERYGKYVLFSTRELNLTQRWFSKWGRWLTLAGRVIPVIRTYIGYPAGLAEMPFGAFVAATAAGSLAWSLLLTGLGYQLGGRLDAIAGFFHRFSVLVFILLVLGLIWYIKLHLSKREQ